MKLSHFHKAIICLFLNLDRNIQKQIGGQIHASATKELLFVKPQEAYKTFARGSEKLNHGLKFPGPYAPNTNKPL